MAKRCQYMKLVPLGTALKDAVPTAWPATRWKLFADRFYVATGRFDHVVFFFRPTRPRRPTHSHYLRRTYDNEHTGKCRRQIQTTAFSEFGKSTEPMSRQNQRFHSNNRLDSTKEENDTRHYSSLETFIVDYTVRSFHTELQVLLLSTEYSFRIRHTKHLNSISVLLHLRCIVRSYSMSVCCAIL